MSTEKQRVQFDFTSESLKRLEDIRVKTEASTKAEVVRNALKLYEWFTSEVKPGHIIELRDADGILIFKIPASVLFS